MSRSSSTPRVTHHLSRLRTIASEFREFAVKGNVIDLAVGIIIGGGFGKIVTSLVGDIVMPSIGYFTRGISFADLVFTLAPAVGDTPAVVIRYGAFIQTIIEFFIVALAVFLLVQGINRLRRVSDAKETAATRAEERLLIEIRDLLKKN